MEEFIKDKEKADTDVEELKIKLTNALKVVKVNFRLFKKKCKELILHINNACSNAFYEALSDYEYAPPRNLSQADSYTDMLAQARYCAEDYEYTGCDYMSSLVEISRSSVSVMLTKLNYTFKMFGFIESLLQSAIKIQSVYQNATTNLPNIVSNRNLDMVLLDIEYGRRNDSSIFYTKQLNYNKVADEHYETQLIVAANSEEEYTKESNKKLEIKIDNMREQAMTNDSRSDYYRTTKEEFNIINQLKELLNDLNIISDKVEKYCK